MVKRKYFNLSSDMEVRTFEEFERPLGWNRLDEANIKRKESVLSTDELDMLKEENKK